MLAFLPVLSYLIQWEAQAESLLTEFWTQKSDEKYNRIKCLRDLFIKSLFVKFGLQMFFDLTSELIQKATSSAGE